MLSSKEEEFRRILDKPIADRTLADLQSIDDCLLRVRVFAQLSDDVRFNLAKTIGFQSYNPREAIIHQGDVGNEYYVIRQGSVSVSVLDPDGQTRVLATLFNHEAFGELALMKSPNEERRRAATVTAREATEIFIVKYEDYISILKPVIEKGLKEKMEFLNKALIFQSLPKSSVQSLAYLFLQKSFPTNSVIVEQGDECNQFYFIVTGSCRIIRAIHAKPNASSSSKHDTVQADVESTGREMRSLSLVENGSKRGSVTAASNEKIYLDLGMLNPGDFFGEEFLFKVTHHKETISSVGAVTLYHMNKTDLLKRIDQQVIEDVGKFGRRMYSDAELWQRHRKSQKWESYKKDLVQKVIGDKQRRHSGHFPR